MSDHKQGDGTVTDSCGCVFCDLGISHPSGVVCPVAALKKAVAALEEIVAVDWRNDHAAGSQKMAWSNALVRCQDIAHSALKSIQGRM